MTSSAPVINRFLGATLATGEQVNLDLPWTFKDDYPAHPDPEVERFLLVKAVLGAIGGQSRTIFKTSGGEYVPGNMIAKVSDFPKAQDGKD